MKPSLTLRTTAILLAICLQTLGLTACDSSTKTTSSTTRAVTASDHPAPTPEGPTADADADSDGAGAFDSDDTTTRHFGHIASPADAAQIAALVRRYYADEAHENGAAACELLASTYAESVPEDYGTSPPGPAWAQGKTCAEVLDRTFARYHDEIVQRMPRLKLERIRTIGREGVVLLYFGHSQARRELRVAREGRRWTVVSLIDNRLL